MHVADPLGGAEGIVDQDGERGVFVLQIAQREGGLGLGFEYSVIINEELIREDGFGVRVPLHSNVGTPYIYSYGLPEAKGRWFRGCTTGETITAIGFTELNAGSDLAAIRTTTRREGDTHVINGQNTFITNRYFADQVIVAAKTDPGAEYK